MARTRVERVGIAPEHAPTASHEVNPKHEHSLQELTPGKVWGED